MKHEGAGSPGTSANRLLTISNLLSIARALLAIPFAFVVLGDSAGARLWGAGIMIVAALTDKLDGVIARRYQQVTEWGKILDPLADKIGVGVVALVLLVREEIPLWFVGLLILRDILIFAGGMYLKTRNNVLVQSNEVGKWTVGIVALTLFLMVLSAQTILVTIFLWASVILLAVSFLLYLNRFRQLVKS
jgi:CDP-diacylglycerol--glycerol-3-phosphate 3-phosphatidyltransferase